MEKTCKFSLLGSNPGRFKFFYLGVSKSIREPQDEKMKKRISIRNKKFISCNDSRSATPAFSTVDVREEYASAFRTESYNEFWMRVLALSDDGVATYLPVESTTATRLPSYRLFVEHLLDPNQPTVTRILELTKNRSKIHILLSDYFSETADASVLCSLLLKDIDHTRVRYRALKTTLESLEIARFSPINQVPGILTHLSEFSNSLNPFVPSASSSCRFRATQDGCSKLLKRLESSRDKARAKLQIISRLKRGSAIFLVALTTSLMVIVVSHGLALLAATPGLIMASFELASSRKLARVSAQLDAAAKGTYTLNKDLDTISRLVARLNDELEHKRSMVRFWLDRGDNRLQAGGEVARQLKKNDSSFSQQLDELEEHLYLCFMTINRARNLVIKEFLDSGQPIGALNNSHNF